jgi:hypothetical protein
MTMADGRGERVSGIAAFRSADAGRHANARVGQ